MALQAFIDDFAGGVVVFLWIVPLQIRALAEDDPLQKAVNYLFTGRNDPQDAPRNFGSKIMRGCRARSEIQTIH